MKISTSFCFNIFSLLKEFLSYKFYYIDPLFINLENFLNCKDNNTNYSKFRYHFEFKSLQKCLNEDIFDDSCYELCKQYHFGSISDFFLGDINVYSKII